MPYAETVAALTSIKLALDITKGFRDSVGKLEKAEINLRLTQLTQAILDAKEETLEIRDVLSCKDEEIKELKAALKIKANLQYEAPYYWLMDGESKDGPYCQSCQDKEQMLVRLQNHGKGDWRCKVCNNMFEDGDYPSPMPLNYGKDWMTS